MMPNSFEADECFQAMAKENKWPVSQAGDRGWEFAGRPFVSADLTDGPVMRNEDGIVVMRLRVERQNMDM